MVLPSTWDLLANLILIAFYILCLFFLARLISTISTYYTYSASVSGAIYEGGKYKEIESDSDFNDEDCGAYCYLDISTPCRAYATIATKCHLLNLESGTSDIIDTQVIKYNSGKERNQ